MIRAEGRHRLHGGACCPDGACGVLGQHFRAKVAELRKRGVGELAVPRSRMGSAAGTPTGIKDRCTARCAPWIELGPVLWRARGSVARYGAVLWVIDCRFH